MPLDEAVKLNCLAGRPAGDSAVASMAFMIRINNHCPVAGTGRCSRTLPLAALWAGLALHNQAGSVPQA